MLKTVRSKDGAEIAFDQLGEGPPVILVCGAQTTRMANAALAERLAAHFTVFNYDRRGRGDSGDRLPYAVEREVEDLEAVIQAAGGSAFVYGISSGAVLALEAAARGLNIRKLVLYEPPFVVEANGSPTPAEHAVQLAELVSAGRRGDAVEHFMTKIVGMPAEVAVQARQSPWWAGSEAIAHTLVYDMTILGDGSLPAQQLASVTVPVMVVGGAQSPEILRRSVQALAKALPNARSRMLENQDHNISADALAPVLKEFFHA